MTICCTAHAKLHPTIHLTGANTPWSLQIRISRVLQNGTFNEVEKYKSITFPSCTNTAGNSQYLFFFFLLLLSLISHFALLTVPGFGRADTFSFVEFHHPGEYVYVRWSKPQNILAGNVSVQIHRAFVWTCRKLTFWHREIRANPSLPTSTAFLNLLL